MFKIWDNWNKLWMLDSKLESIDKQELIISQDNIKYVFVSKENIHVCT